MKVGNFMQVIGFKSVQFETDDKTLIKGYSVYVIDKIDSEGVHDGLYSERIFLNEKKFNDLNIKELYENETPFTILYNRFGKVEKIIS